MQYTATCVDEGWNLAQYSLAMQPVQMRVKLVELSTIFIMQLVQMRVELRVQYSCVINSTLPWQPNFTSQHGVGKGGLHVQLGGTCNCAE